MKNFDLAIIGSGPGGYVAALYASRKKLKVCVIEKDLVGGTCLNRGCIPTKVMLNSASVLSTVRTAETHGIKIEGYKIDFQKILSRKDEVVLRLRTGIETLFRAGGIELIKGAAAFTSAETVSIEGAGEIKARSIIIAAGSKVAGIPGIKIDEENVLSSDGILNVSSVPKNITIIGGGVIGCEFASLFNALGSKVKIVELLDRLITSQSREASKKLEMIFKKRGIEVATSAKAAPVDISSGKTLVAVGRAPNTEGLGLEKLGIKRDKGRIVVDEQLRTSVNNIFAIGDCVAGPLLAHKASYDGIVACDNILGLERKADYSNIPSCIYTDPEIASVGLTEEEAKAKYSGVRAAKFPYLASGKAYIEGKPEGYVKIVGRDDGTLLGTEIFGERACDLIGEAVMAKTAGMNIKEMAHVVHGHPTVSEIIQEAAHVFCGTAIHGI